MLSYDATALVGTIFMLITLLRLRAILARVFPTITARVVNAKAPEGLADLYAAAYNELCHMGFEGPIWLMLDHEPEEAGLFRLCAVYQHPEQHMLAWLHQPAQLKTPNRLLSYWTTTLNDGRTVVSQAFDTYFESFATDAMPANTIYGKTLSEQRSQHIAFRAKFIGHAKPVRLQHHDIVRLADEAMNQQRDTLVKQGKLWRNDRGIIRIRLGFALRILWHSFRSKAAKDPASPIPPTRLALLARMIERARLMEPDMKTQLWLFGSTVALSAILGALLWDIRFALILLFVILFHEFGHYLAMRAFGYRNVHMMALPLVGGVTIGIDAKPSGAKRAWMSLMGPLPGIIIGWALAYLLFTGDFDTETDKWLRITAMLLLFINYLNVIPMLPLDGGHVVQALLPPRWINIQAVIVALTCLIGMVVFMLLGIYILAFLAGIQLFTLKDHLHFGKAMRRLANEGVPPQAHTHAHRLLRVFQILEEVAGPAKKALPRINQAERILQTFDTMPMTWCQRGLIATIYAALLVVPAAAAAFSLSIALNMPDIEKAAETAKQQEQERKALLQQARHMRLEDLVDNIRVAHHTYTSRPPASEEAIQELEHRLGIELPAELHAFYRHTDGFPELGIAALADIRPAANSLDTMADKLPAGETIKIALYGDTESLTHEMPIDQTKTWLALHHSEDEYRLTLFDLHQPSTIPGVAIIIHTYEENFTGYQNLHAMLEQMWVEFRAWDNEKKRHDQQKAHFLEQFADADIQLLLGQYESPNLITTILELESAWPDGASTAQIKREEQILGYSLPADLQILYQQHNGFPPLQLLSLQKVVHWRQQTRDLLLRRYPDGVQIEGEASNDTQALTLQIDDLSHCIILSGISFTPNDATEESLVPKMLWCPNPSDPHLTFIDPIQMRGYNTFSDYVRNATADWKSSYEYATAEP